MRTIKYCACCPVCGHRYPRFFFYDTSFRCLGCEIPLRENPTKARAIAITFALPAGIILPAPFFGVISWLTMILILPVLFVGLHYADHYFLPLERVPPKVLKARRKKSKHRWDLGQVLVRLWRQRLTPPGRYVLVGAASTSIAGAFPETAIGEWAFSFFAALVLLCMVWAMVRRPAVNVHRTMPRRCTAGAIVPLTIEVRNPSSRTQLNVAGFEFDLPEGLKISQEAHYIPELAPGQVHRTTYRVLAQRRGIYELAGPTALAAAPLCVCQSRRFSSQSHHLVVGPSYQPLQRLDLPAAQRCQPGGMALASRVGESMEFIAVREYQSGDRIRDLHPRSWARVGHPVVKQFEQEFFSRVALLVDTYAPRERWRRLRNIPWRFWNRQTPRVVAQNPMEAGLCLAAAISDYLAGREYVVDLFAAGPRLYHFQAGRSLAYLENILDILACLEGSEEDPMDQVADAFARQIPMTSTAVLVLLAWDRRRQGLVQAITSGGVPVKIILVSESPQERDAALADGVQVFSTADVRRGVEAL